MCAVWVVRGQCESNVWAMRVVCGQCESSVAGVPVGNVVTECKDWHSKRKEDEQDEDIPVKT